MKKEDFIRLSPSQIKTSKDCLRKWGLTYLDGIRQPDTVATKAGTELHTVAEEWLRGESIPDATTKAGKLFLAGVNFLPLPSDDLLVEQGFEFWDGPLLWRGFVDLINPTSEPLRITDHKTTSNLRWALNSEQLREDVQATIYAKYAFDRFGVDTLEAQWVYYQKGSRPKARETIINLAKSEVNDRYSALRVLGTDLLGLQRTHKSGLEIEVSEFPHEGCRKYGGCYFFDVCRSKEEGKENMSDLLAKLKKNGKSSKETPALPAAINPPVVVEAAPIEPEEKKGIPHTEIVVPVEEKETFPPKRKRGRPRKTPEALPEYPPKIELEKIRLPEETTPSHKQGFRLFVDCAPVEGFGKVVSGNRLIREAATVAAEENGVAHYRFIEYGAGPGALSVALEKILDREAEVGQLVGCSVVVDASDQTVKDCVSVFEGRAVGTVRGLR